MQSEHKQFTDNILDEFSNLFYFILFRAFEFEHLKFHLENKGGFVAI